MNRTHTKWIGLGAALLLVLLLFSLRLLAEPRTPIPRPNPSRSLGRSAIPRPVRAALSPAAIASVAPFLQTSSNQPKITWSPTSSIEVILSPGESTSKDLTFTSDQDLQNPVVEPVPEIAGFLTIQPNTIAALPAAQQQPVHIAIAIPASTAFGTYSGTIHVRIGTQTLPQTVKVVVNAWQSSTSTTLRVTFKYPPNLFVLISPDQPGHVLIQNSPIEVNLGGALPEDGTQVTSTGFVISLSATSYGKPFTIAGWLVDTSPYSQIGHISSIQVGGIQSYRVRFSGEVGEGEPTVIVPRPGLVFTASYDSSYVPDSSQEQSALHVFDLFLQTIQFTP
jgi:hypothetical protein